MDCRLSNSFLFTILILLKLSTLTPGLTHVGLYLMLKNCLCVKVSVSVLWCDCTHNSGEIFIWPSTIRHMELKRIIHISIISFPLFGPLLSDLLAFPAFPRLRQFIPAAAAICISPAIVACWLQREKMKLGQGKVRLQVLRFTVPTQKERDV